MADGLWLDFYAVQGAELPLWWVSAPALSLDELPIRPGLREGLRRWQAQFDLLPADAPRPAEFDAQGRRLLAEVREQLGAGWRVTSSWYDDDASEQARELDDPHRPSRTAAFDDLPAATKREVAQLAKRGQRHPDPAVANAARAWADETIGRRGEVAGSLIFSVVLGAITGGVLADPSACQELSRRRLAKRLIALDQRTEGM